jgi:two-component system sensor histidine kinase ChvG
MVHRLRNTADMLRQSAEDNAHAFKGPIAIIRQVLEPLVGKPATPDQLNVALPIVQVALERLDGLIASARRLDTATADLLEIGGGRVDLTALLHGLVADFRAMRAATPVHIVETLDRGVVVLGESEAVESIFENLLENAADFSPPDSTVQLLLTVAAGEAWVTVRDEGPGVPEASLQRIFDRYYSTRRTGAGADDAVVEEASKDRHFGIGLWIARQNARALGGDVTAANGVPTGLVVSVRLKVA